MKVEYQQKQLFPSMGRSRSTRSNVEPARSSGFTVVEVVVTIALVLIVVISSLSALMFLWRSTARGADYTAAAASVQGRMEAVRAATYNPPNYPFTSSPVTLTNVTSVSLSASGGTYLVPGTNITLITPSASGHLVTVTGTFGARGRAAPLVVSLESFVNQFSGGQQ